MMRAISKLGIGRRASQRSQEFLGVFKSDYPKTFHWTSINAHAESYLERVDLPPKSEGKLQKTRRDLI